MNRYSVHGLYSKEHSARTGETLRIATVVAPSVHQAKKQFAFTYMNEPFTSIHGAKLDEPKPRKE